MKAASLLTFALCAGVAAAAQAQTVATDKLNVSIYGVLDIGVGTEAHSQDWTSSMPGNAQPLITQSGDKAVTGMFGGGVSGDRLGVRGDYRLNEDWKAIFCFESAFNINSGQFANAAATMTQPSNATGNSVDSSLSGQLFARQSWVGIASPVYGSLTFGRNIALGLDMVVGYDPVQAAQLFSPIGYAGTYGAGGSTDNARVDNSIKYKLKADGFSLGLLYGFGNKAGSTSAGAQTQISVGYEAGPFSITAAYQSANDVGILYNPNVLALEGTAGASASGDPTVQGATPAPGNPLLTGTGQYGYTVLWTDTKAAFVFAKYKLGPVTLKGGYEHIDIGDPSNWQLDQNVTSYLGQSVGGNITGLFGAQGVPDKTLTLYFLGGDWNVTSQFNVALGYYHVAQNNFSGAASIGANGSDPSHFSGTTTYTSLLLDYHFTKKFDAYFGYMGTKVTDGMDYAPYFQGIVGSLGSAKPTASGEQLLHDSNSMMGVGLRLVF